MSSINVSYLKIDSNSQIIDYNDNLVNLFNLGQPAKHQSISTIINSLNENPSLKSMNNNDIYSCMLFCNSRINAATEYNSMLILYAAIKKQGDHHIIRITNWLNWLHQITDSLEHGYSFMSKFNETTAKDKFSKISDACCYKALYPLITYIPKKFSSGVSQSSLFEIMRIFVKRREEGGYNKDYARNVYSRIRTNLKQEFNLDNFNAVDIIKDNKLLKIKYNNNIHVPNTLLLEDIILLTEHDKLLLNVIESVCPSK